MRTLGSHTPIAAKSHRVDAILRARAVCCALEEIGVKARIFGSLASGDFAPTSDIDLLVSDCPRSLKYSIEGLVEDHLGTIPFDLVYLDEIPEYKKARFVAGAIDARDIR